MPDELRPAVADRLVELIRKADTHLGTGFLATPYLLPVLADTGHLDVAYELLLQDTEPSWLVMVDRGATTVWERWNGVSADGVPHESLNHYSKGAVVSFLHRYTAGIELVEPAYRRFRIRPRPGGGLTAAEAAHESPYGRIESSWRLDGDAFELRVVVPAGTSPRSSCPTGRDIHGRRPGEHTYTDARGEDAAMTAETTEWAGPARFLPPTEPTRRDDGVRHHSASPTPHGRLPAAAARPLGAGPPLPAARRLDPRWRLDDRRPALPARDAAAEPAVRRAARRRSRGRDDRLPAGPGGAVPAQLHDAKAAIRYLRAHADELGIDTGRIGVWGESAGDTSPRSSASPGARPTWRAASGSSGRRARSTSSSTGTARRT